MAYSTILYEVDDRVAWITVNRPDRMNALNLKFEAECSDALAAADRDPEVRVVVITGAGERSFSSGFDLQDEVETGEVRKGLDDWKRRLNYDKNFFYSLWSFSKPTVAMINGYCLAGAIDLAQMCDIRYCSEDATFSLTETRFAAGFLTLPSMSWIIGQRCRELIYTGDVFDAQEAHRLGFVSRVFAKDRLKEEVTRIAKRMSRVALPTLTWNKKALNNTLAAAGFDPALRYSEEACLFIDTSQSEFDQFRELARSDVKAALKWRDAIFEPFESEWSSFASRKAAANAKKGAS